MEIKDVTRCSFMTPAPELITINLAEHEQHMSQLRAQREKDEPTPSTADFRKEYNQLRQQLFNLQQNAKAYEIRTNEAAGKIRLVEERINEALKLKKAASDAGNLRGERTYEHSVATLETELLDAQEEFHKNKHWSVQAARQLKDFNQHGRIAELKALLAGEGSPVAKRAQLGPK